MYGPPYWFATDDWAGRNVALSIRRWDKHIKAGRAWINDRMIPLIQATIQDPDEAFESDRNSREAEIWRHFDDVKDGTPDFLKVIVRYDTLILSATSGDVVTAYIEQQIDSRGTQIWIRP
jgi:hypothetical protein